MTNIYKSTRSSVCVSPSQAVLQGIAPDGGLYVNPDMASLSFDWEKCLTLDSLGMAEMILNTLLPGYADMHELVRRAYSGKFETEDLTPVVKVGENYVLELFRGPTSAFKDVALSMLPQLVTAAREANGVTDKIVILTATSGDTGKAALEGFHDVDGTEIIVFFPDGGVSPVQRAQMVTQVGANVHVCAVRGNFDDCQRGVKEAFAALNAGNALAGSGKRLSSANSINIGRLAPQVVYYFIAYAMLLKDNAVKLGEPVDYVVPTGNFGDILAGYFAKLLGLPVGRLVCASNDNDVLVDFIRTGVYDSRRPFMRTTSPSMDILVSSNLERLLYLASGNDAQMVSEWMAKLKSEGCYRVPENVLKNIQENFSAGRCCEAEAEETIRSTWESCSYLCDTHTAVALSVAETYKKESETSAPVVVLSTASPYKFPAAVLKAISGDNSGDEFEQMNRIRELTGVPIPKNLAGLKEKQELHTGVIDKDALIDYVRSILGVS